MKIYHNPRCTKSRQTLALLEEKGQTPEVVLYLQEAPSVEELRSIVQQLGISAFDLIRKGEKVYKEQFKGQDLSEEEWLQVLHENPKLIERPIVVTEKGAAIGRPPEKVLEII